MPGTTPVVNDIVKLRVVCTVPGQVGVNITHWVVGTPVGAGLTLQEIATKFEADLAGPYTNWIANPANFIGVAVQNITGVPTVEFRSAVLAGVGIAGASLLPSQVSGLIHWRTQQAHRSMQGRIFPPFPPVGFDDTAGKMTVGGQIKLDNIRTAYGLGKVYTVSTRTTTLSLILKHGPRKGGLPPLEDFTLVTSATTSALWATQRRRGDYGRQNLPTF